MKNTPPPPFEAISRVAVFDANVIDRLLRKAAFCRSFMRNARLAEVKNFLTTDLYVRTDPPRVVRDRAAEEYKGRKVVVSQLLANCDTSGLNRFLGKEEEQMLECRRMMDRLQQKADRRNRANAWWLFLGQVGTATVGVAAGLALAAMTFGGATVLLFGAEGATFAGLSIGTTSTAGFGTTGFVLRQGVNLSHTWSEADKWDAVALTGTGAGVGKSGEGDVGKVQRLISAGKTFVQDNGETAVVAGAHGYAAGGAKGILPVVGLSLATKREFEAYWRALESPQARQRRQAG